MDTNTYTALSERNEILRDSYSDMMLDYMIEENLFGQPELLESWDMSEDCMIQKSNYIIDKFITSEFDGINPKFVKIFIEELVKRS